MIDLHCHILPALDDGPKTLAEAVSMCRIAAEDGIETIVATPHHKPGTYEFTGPVIDETIALLSAEIAKQGLRLNILPGAEVNVTPEMSESVNVGGRLTINRSRYFLAEFRPFSVPAHWDEFLLSFKCSGLTPIIAHPERNFWFISHPEALEAAVRAGILLQITAMSVTGGFGPDSQGFSIDLLRKNLVHVIASDGHSALSRPPLLSEAVALAADLIGRERAEALVTIFPRAVIEGLPVPALSDFSYKPPTKVVGNNWFRRLIGIREKADYDYNR